LLLVSKAEAKPTGNRFIDDMINASNVAGTVCNSIETAAQLNTALGRFHPFIGHEGP